jgi:WD40 repeat protein
MVFKRDDDSIYMNCMDVTHDRKAFILCGCHGGMCLDRPEKTDEKKTHDLETFRVRVNVAKFSPDCRKLVSAPLHRKVTIWDVESGKELYVFKDHTNKVRCAAWSPDGKLVASGGDCKAVLVWEADTGRIVRGPLIGHDQAVRCVAFSNKFESGIENGFLVSGSTDRTVVVWEFGEGEHVGVRHRLMGHADWVTAVAVSPDDRCVASGSCDRTVRLWRTDTAEPLKVLDGHITQVAGLAWSPDGQFVMAEGADKTARVWKSDFVVRFLICVLAAK